MTLKHLTEQQLSMMCSPDHPKNSFYQIAFWWHSDVIVTCTYKQVPMLALTPPFYEKQRHWKRTPKSSSAVKQDLHGLGWVQTESEKSKANKLAHTLRANTERQAFLTRLVHTVQSIPCSECSHAFLLPAAIKLKVAQTSLLYWLSTWYTTLYKGLGKSIAQVQAWRATWNISSGFMSLST